MYFWQIFKEIHLYNFILLFFKINEANYAIIHKLQLGTKKLMDKKYYFLYFRYVWESLIAWHLLYNSYDKVNNFLTFYSF